MRIAGTTAVITGASSGIGAATAQALAAAGARVVLLARTAAALEQQAAQIRARGGAALVYPVDLADMDAAEQTARAVLGQAGPPDILVNNAGAGRWLFLEETAPEEARAMMAVPYMAAFAVTRAFLPAMLARRRRASLVFVNSPASLMPWPGATAYTAARWALRGFTEALRADLRGTPLRITAVVPGRVSSAYFANNPGVEERIPGVARLLPTVTPERAAAEILRGIERGRRLVIFPAALRALYYFNAVVPGPVRWLTYLTGARREHLALAGTRDRGRGTEQP